jgi:nitroreductase
MSFERLPEHAMHERGEAFLAAMRTQRSVREFAPDPVPRELIESAIAAALTAPSGANRQPWHFVAVSDPAVKREIRVAAEAEERAFYESVGIACGFFIAALHLAGLATLTHTPQPMRFLSRILSRPVNERPYILFPVGYPAPGCTVPAITRKPASATVTWLE